MNLPYDPSISLLHLPIGNEMYAQTRSCVLMALAAFIVNQKWKQNNYQ